MPSKLNVGLSRKVGEPNYGSRGASINMELELDSSLVGEPARLRAQTRQLFNLARTSLAAELDGKEPKVNGGDGGNCPQAPSTRSNGLRKAAPSQVRAITSIARAKGIELGRICTSGSKSAARRSCRSGRPAPRSTR